MTLPSPEQLLSRPPTPKSDGTYDGKALAKWFLQIYNLLRLNTGTTPYNIPNLLGTSLQDAQLVGSVGNPGSNSYVPTEKAVRSALSIASNDWINVKDPAFGGAVGGYWDTAVANAYAATPDYGVLLFPPGTYPMTDTFTITKPITVKGSGRKSTILTTSQDISNIVVGTYVYDGMGSGTNAWDNAYRIDDVEISDLKIENTGTPIGASIGLDIRGGAYGNYYNINIFGPVISLAVKPVSSWNDFSNFLCQGTLMVDGVKVYGDGYDSTYNSTGNTYDKFKVVSFTRAAFEAYGEVFGDIIVSNLFGFGNSGSAGVFLTSTGSKYYANKVAINGIDMDGSMTYGLYADGVSQLRAEILNESSLFTTYDVTGGVAGTNIIIDDTGVHAF